MARRTAALSTSSAAPSTHTGCASPISSGSSVTGVSLSSDRITTLGDLVEDIFYITDADDRPINDPATIANLREQTMSALEERIEQLAS